MCFGVGFVVQAASREEAETRVRHVRGAVDHTLPSLVSLTGGEFAEYDLEPGAVKDGYAACVITSWRVSDTNAPGSRPPAVHVPSVPLRLASTPRSCPTRPSPSDSPEVP